MRIPFLSDPSVYAEDHSERVFSCPEADLRIDFWSVKKRWEESNGRSCVPYRERIYLSYMLQMKNNDTGVLAWSIIQVLWIRREKRV